MSLLRSVRALLVVRRPAACLFEPRTFSTYPRLAERHNQAAPQQSKGTPIGQLDRRLQITFTCTAPVQQPQQPQTTTQGEHSSAAAAMTTKTTTTTRPCHHRSTHEFSRRSYEKGIVLVECPSCKNRHLIADNLSWFSSTPSPAHPGGLPIGCKQPRTIEDLMREKGEQVKWVDGGAQGGTWEVEG